MHAFLCEDVGVWGRECVCVGVCVCGAGGRRGTSQCAPGMPGKTTKQSSDKALNVRILGVGLEYCTVECWASRPLRVEARHAGRSYEYWDTSILGVYTAMNGRTLGVAAPPTTMNGSILGVAAPPSGGAACRAVL